MPTFSHLHVHTQYSLLDGASSISALFKKAKADGQPALAITDHGNMFGVFKFVAEAGKHGVKPIVGCEFYLVEDRHIRAFNKDNANPKLRKDNRYHQLFIAKNAKGYQNLSKLCSLGFIEGLYSKYPRIDRELIEKYREGLICTSCCIGASIPQAILHKSEAEAEEEFRWWNDMFGEDFYVEVQRHGLKNLDGTGKSQEDVNQVLLKFAAKYGRTVIATNDSHYTEADEFNAHDILLCVNTQENQATPVGDSKTNEWRFEIEPGKPFYGSEAAFRATYAGHANLETAIRAVTQPNLPLWKGKPRFGFANAEFYMKTQAEMNALFADIPAAIDGTNALVGAVDELKLKRDVLLPNYPLPPGFTSPDDYLEHLSFEGARKKYHEITAEVEERLKHELFVVKTMGFAGYFLIVADFISAAREMGVWVGPGRGSAAGSAVAYAIGITNIDPIKYDLLFERFLNPERVSMPDIDTDFDDEGRQRVIDYVVDKYGKNQVAQIVTFGSMAAKSAIKDVARTTGLPLNQANDMAKLVGNRPGITLEEAIKESPDLRALIALDPNDQRSPKASEARVLKTALTLEGSIRNTGIHAAGIIIAPDDLSQYIPLATAQDSPLLIAQFDGKYIESAGMLKMDFLGLKTLSIIRDAIALAERNNVDFIGPDGQRGLKIDPDLIPLDDPKTFELYQLANTVGTFQFESSGMRQYLKDLRPTHIEDLIAMNALYRPGPMEFIPSFIARKHGTERVDYPHAMLEPILAKTYGIMVYQEQIMQTAQIMGGYSLGGADLLRRAMGKKDAAEMAKQRDIFVAGAGQKGIEPDKANLVFDTMERFAQYGFNRSHSAAYSVLAFQTAYLKANYPAEYMAAVLTNNMSDIKKISFFMDECRRMGLMVKEPDVNESELGFTALKGADGKPVIRFGLGAIKGVGEAAVEALVNARTVAGEGVDSRDGALARSPYTSIFDLSRRVPIGAFNKKTLESLALAGAFDGWAGTHRAQYLYDDGRGSALEHALKYGTAFQSNAVNSSSSLFGEAGLDVIQEPSLPNVPPMDRLAQLEAEKECIGMYISGHPLQAFQLEMENFCMPIVSLAKDVAAKDIIGGPDRYIAGLVTALAQKTTKRGAPFLSFQVEDFSATIELALFNDEYLQHQAKVIKGTPIWLHGQLAKRYNNMELELRVKDIRSLDQLRATKTYAITLFPTVNQATGRLGERLRTILATHAGGKPVRIEIQMPDGPPLKLVSRAYRVEVSDDLIDDLRVLDIPFSLNGQLPKVTSPELEALLVDEE